MPEKQPLKPEDVNKVKDGQNLGKPDAMIVRSQSSCVVKEGSKGATWEIKVYDDDCHAAAKKALDIHNKMKKDLAE